MQFILLNAFLATERALYLTLIGYIELGRDQTGAVLGVWHTVFYSWH